jgi:hypothetical protein
MGKRGSLKFHGHIEEVYGAEVFEAYYQIGNRQPRPLPISRWSSYAGYFRWGMKKEQGCLQLGWTIVFVYLIKQRGLHDRRETSGLLTEDIVKAITRKHIERLPASWSLEEPLLDNFLLPYFPFTQFPLHVRCNTSSYS